MPRKEYLTNYRQFDTPQVGLGDGRVVEAVGVGDVPVTMQFKVSDNKKAVLYDVLFVPKLACNLFFHESCDKEGQHYQIQSVQVLDSKSHWKTSWYGLS